MNTASSIRNSVLKPLFKVKNSEIFEEIGKTLGAEDIYKILLEKNVEIGLPQFQGTNSI